MQLVRHDANLGKNGWPLLDWGVRNTILLYGHHHLCLVTPSLTHCQAHCASNDEECGFEPNDCSGGPVATILGALFEIGLEEGTIQAAGHKKGRKIGGCAKKCKKNRAIHGHSCLTWQ